MWSDLLVACTVCFGAADGPLLTSARIGVLVMVAVTCGVLAAFAAFFLRLARKEDSPLVSTAANRDNPLFSRGRG
ncbi:MAG TPA: hypothetical protein VGI12_03870 [Vicinamibacterales bacterium]|jgi:hypothetical protein